MADTAQILPARKISLSVTKTPGTTALAGSFKVSFRNETSGWIGLTTNRETTQYDLNKKISTLENNLWMLGSVGSTYDALMILPATMFLDGIYEPIEIVETNFTGGIIEGSNGNTSYTTNYDLLFNSNDNQYWAVIPSDFLRTIEELPQLRVWINDTLSVCKGNCSYSYLSPPEIPFITGYVQTLSTLTITGNNFPERAESISIKLGYVPCDIETITVSQIECAVGQGVAGNYKPVVKHNQLGIIPIDESVTDTITIGLNVVSISPSVGSIKGGTLVTISGFGFFDSLNNEDYSQTVMVGGSPCEITSTSTTIIRCLTSEQTLGSEVVVSVNEYDADLSSYLYSVDHTPLITSVSPEYASTIFKTSITIIGNNFSVNKNDISVTIGEERCMVLYATETQIDCNLLGGPVGVYILNVMIEGIGYAEFKSPLSNNYALKFEIESISPQIGSTTGGASLTISGHGFSDRPSSLLVFISDKDHECVITSVPNPETIICTVPALDSNLRVDTDYRVFIVGRVQMVSQCKGTCMFRYSSDVDPQILTVNPANAFAGDLITLTGVNFGNLKENVHLKFGDVEATVESATDNEITAYLPAVKGRTPDINLLIDQKGKATVADITFINDISILSVTPKIISRGGEDITITGSGFSTSQIFVFGSTSCVVSKLTNDQVVCKAGPYNLSNSVQSLIISEDGYYECSDPDLCGIIYSLDLTPIFTGAITGFFTIPI